MGGKKGEPRNHGFLAAGKNAFVSFEDFSNGTSSDVHMVSRGTQAQVIHNKRRTGTLKRRRDDRVVLIITLVPCPVFCLVSLLVSHALAEDIFEVVGTTRQTSK